MELLKYITSDKPRRATKAPMCSVCLLLFCPVELLKTKTSYKPRRAREAAAAARFFDDDARNLYGAYLRGIKRKYAPHVPEAYLMVAREISGVRAKKIPQMRHFDAHAFGER